MSKLTAVDWLIEEMKKQYHLTNETLMDFEAAKAMEKEQICTSYVYGAAYGIDTTNDFKPEIYYKETYGGNND